MIMTLKEFAKNLDGREYLHEITKKEEALAKELGFVWNSKIEKELKNSKYK